MSTRVGMRMKIKLGGAAERGMLTRRGWGGRREVTEKVEEVKAREGVR